jgi:flagellar hook-associated protein 1 FlgK
MESILDEDTTNLTARITDFYNAWQALATDPTGSTARLEVVTAGENMCQTIREIYGELKGLQTELDDKVAQTVDDVNNILQSIAGINAEMKRSGADNPTLLGERTALVKQLSGMMDIQYFEDTGGALTVMTSDGNLLVDGVKANSLSAEESADGVYRVNWVSASGAEVDITGDISAGSLKSLIDLRDNQITAFIGDINDLAGSLATEVNAIHSAGYTETGVTGIDFFNTTTATGDYAAVMDLSDEVAASEDYVAATSSAGNTSGNETALAIAALGSATVTIGGRSTTYIDHCTSILSEIGGLSENAQDLSEYHQALLSSVETQRDSVSAVSTDEEMIDLVKFQYAYQAAARLLTTADELLSSLLEAI